MSNNNKLRELSLDESNAVSGAGVFGSLNNIVSAAVPSIESIVGEVASIVRTIPREVLDNAYSISRESVRLIDKVLK